jgi:hypothetical protein
VEDIGIRMALGASATHLQGQILLQTLRLAGVGLALRSLLFGVTSGRESRIDPMVALPSN